MNLAGAMGYLFNALYVHLINDYDTVVDRERFRRQRLDVLERYTRDVARGRICHLPEDTQ